MRVVVISGHGLVGRGDPDPGAGEGEAAEGRWTADLCDLTTLAIRAAGYESGGVEVGTSRERTTIANRVDPDLVLYLHGDVGTPAVYFYPGSPGGRDAVGPLQSALQKVLPWTIDVRSASRTGYPRAHGLLGQGKAPAVLIEVVDVRNEANVDWLLEHLDLVAGAIAAAVPFIGRL